MAKLTLRTPWTRQPQVPVEINLGINIRQIWGMRGTRLFEHRQQGFVSTPNSPVKVISSGVGLAIGSNDGPTAVPRNGTTQTVTIGVIGQLTGTGGRLYSESGVLELIPDSSTSFSVFVGGSARWTISWARLNKSAIVFLYDFSSTVNAPTCYVDGVAATVTFVATPTAPTSSGGKMFNHPAGAAMVGTVQGGFYDSLVIDATLAKSLSANPWQLFAPLSRTIWAPAAGGGGVSGTLATTNANDTSAASGSPVIVGSLAKTNANDTSAASGTTTVSGTLARTNANDTSAASGSPVVAGTLARTNADDSVVASGSVGNSISGSVAVTNANDTNVATGTTTVTGSLAKTNANDSVAASGTTTVIGSLARTNANDSVVASGVAGAISGTVNVTNDNDTIVASGTAGNPVIASQGGGGWLPQTRRKSRKQIYEERVKLGILPPPVIKAAAKVAAVAQTVEEFREERPRYEEMFLKAIKKTEWLPDYTRAIQAQLAIMESEEEELLFLL